MKQLFAVIMLLVCVSFAFAQPNQATVTDNGSLNTAYINQLGGTLADPNKAFITQTGDKNTADQTDLYASSLYPVLTGTKGITQSGKGNEGNISQTLTNSPISAGPIAGIGQYADFNKATITQTSASVWAQGYAWVKQTGASNTSLQNQGLISYQFSHVYQTGSGNKAETQQPLDGYNQKANILQSGNDNDALQYQGAIGYTQGNLAEATQSGNGNWSRQWQYGSSNVSRTIQSSGLNVSELTQNGNANDIRVEQKTGAANIVHLTQNGGAIGDIFQDGDGNVVMGLNADPMGTSLNGSTLNVDQLGSSNTLHLQQTNGASATVFQDGVTNTAVVIQN